MTPIEEEILCEYPCGFRKGRSTVEQLFSMRQLRLSRQSIWIGNPPENNTADKRLFDGIKTKSKD